MLPISRRAVDMQYERLLLKYRHIAYAEKHSFMETIRLPVTRKKYPRTEKFNASSASRELPEKLKRKIM
jgi:hypothetical protein